MSLWLELLLVGALALGLGGLAALVTETLRTSALVRRRMRTFAEALNADAQGLEEASRQMAAAPVRAAKAQNPVFAWFNGRFPLAGGGRVSLIAIVSAAVAFAGLAPFLIFLGMSTVLGILSALAVAAALGWNLGLGMETRRRNDYNDRLLLAMEDFQRMVRFGIPAMQSLKSVGDAAEEPLKASLQNILLETGFGVPLEQAMAQEARRVRMSEMAMLAAIISTQTTTGGNLSEAVGNLATMLRERRDNRAKLKASTAESRVTLVILSIVPVLGVGIQSTMQPDLLKIMFGEARHLLGIGLALIVAGLAMSYLMIRGAQR